MGSPRALPTLPSWLTLGGTTVTPAEMQQLNTYMQFFSSPPMFSMYQSSAQSVANNSFVQITCDTQDWDTDFGRGSSSPWTYTIPTGLGGRWQFSAMTAWSGNATGDRGAAIYVNGSQANGCFWSEQAAPAVNVTAVGGSRTINVAAGATIALMGFQTSGGSLSTQGGSFGSFIEGRLVSLANP